VAGSISVIDILLFCLNVCQTGQEIVEAFGLPLQDKQRLFNFETITNYLRTDTKLAAAFSTDNARFIANYSKREALPMIPPNSTIKQLLDILSTSHRVAVVDNQNLVNYITQSDAIEYLHNNKDLLGGIANKSIGALHIAEKKVISVQQTAPVLEAFKKMILDKVSGIAVVNEKNEIIGCISAHDIRGITGTGELLEHLYHPYAEYKNIMDSIKVISKAQVIKNTAQTSLGEVVETFVKEKVHRIFVTDDHNHAVGVISLGDVLKCVSEQ